MSTLLSFAATQTGSRYIPAVGQTAWLVRTETCEAVRITQCMDRTETCAVLPVRDGSIPVTALWEDLHRSEETALQHLEHRARQIMDYAKHRRDAWERAAAEREDARRDCRNADRCDGEAAEERREMAGARFEAMDRDDGISWTGGSDE